MDAARPEQALPPAWLDALGRAAACRRVLVLGATDMGKSTFIHALLGAAPHPIGLVDLDPGQKMLGPPGTIGWGNIHSDTGEERLERFIFLGSTSASLLGAIARGAAELAGVAGALGPFVVNTSGFVAGLGARLQALTAASVKPDLIVQIGEQPATLPAAAVEGAAHIRLERSPAAVRKSPRARAAVRQAAFARSLSGAVILQLPPSDFAFHPAPPLPLYGNARPVCALTDAAGNDMAVGVLKGIEEEVLLVEAPPPDRPVRLVRIGKMWAEPSGEGGWQLLEKLSRSWAAEAG